MTDKKSIFLKWLFVTTFVATLVGIIVLIVRPIAYTYYKLFSDFAEVLSYCLVKNPYDGSSGITSIYPPIAHLIFYPFLLFCKQDIQDLVNGQITLNEIHTRIMFVVAYLTYVIITLTLILLVIAKMTKLKGKNLWYLLGAIIFSGPICFVFNRGNVILVSLLMALIFFWLYQSEKRWQRELALICLALSIAIKIYPVLLVLVLLNQRRWLDIVKVGLYTALFVFVPFVFISGNIFDNVLAILDSYNRHINKSTSPTSVSFVGTASALAHLCKIHFGIEIGDVLLIIANVLKYLLLITAVITILLCHRNTKKMSVATIVIGCYTFFPNVSYGYVLIFSFILLTMFLNSIETLDKKDFITHFVMFLLIFFSIPYLFKFCVIQFFVIIFLVIKAIIDLLHEYVKTKRAERQLDTQKAIQVQQ